ncbi:MAG: YdcF family protein [Bryobacteraceae bacterium]
MPWLRKFARVLLSGCAILGALMLVATFTPLVRWYARALAGNWEDARGDVLIVLGGGAIDERTLALGSYWRAVYAGLAWREGGFREVVMSGASTAPLMRDYLVCHGVPAAAIRVENEAHDTRESALYVQRLLAGVPGRKVLLTSDYHMFRARRAFEKVGLQVGLRPFPDVLKSATHVSGRWPAFLTLCEETAKIVYYWARGWI